MVGKHSYVHDRECFEFSSHQQGISMTFPNMFSMVQKKIFACTYMYGKNTVTHHSDNDNVDIDNHYYDSYGPHDNRPNSETQKSVYYGEIYIMRRSCYVWTYIEFLKLPITFLLLVAWSKGIRENGNYKCIPYERMHSA